jgi:hypothetical protein
MADNNFRRPPRKKNVLDETKLRLSADPVSGSKRRPSLAFSVVKNNPRIDVYTNVEGDKNNGNIRAAMDAPVFFALMRLIEKSINAEPNTRFVIQNKNYKWFGQGKKSDAPINLSDTLAGKDAEGRIFISVIDKEDNSRPKIKFVFSSGYWHDLFHGNGTPFTEAEDSVLCAEAFVEMLKGLVPVVMAAEYEPPAPRDQQGGHGNKGYGGGNQGGGNSYGGQSQPSTTVDFDEDIF